MKMTNDRPMPTKNAADHDGHKIKMDRKYDAYFCADCNVWLENACGDPECDFCAGRPKKPFP